MSLPHRHSTIDLRAPRDPSPALTKPRPLSLSSFPNISPPSLTPTHRSSIPRPSHRTPQTPTPRSSSFHKPPDPNDSSIGFGLGVGLGFSSLARSPRPSPPNGRASPALRRSLSTLSRRPSGPLGTSIPARKRRKRKKKKDGGSSSSNSSSNSGSSNESSTANSSSVGVEDAFTASDSHAGRPRSIFMHGEEVESFTAKEFFIGTFALFDPLQTGSVRIPSSLAPLSSCFRPLTSADQYPRLHPALP